MRKIINLNKKSLSQLKKDVDNMSKKMEQAAKDLAKELSEYGLKEMESIYKNYDLKSNVPSIFRIDGTDNYKQVIMEGPQAIYDEFGTGTEGQLRPHPIKGEFNLKDYNTGRTIRHAGEKVSKETSIPFDGLYWTYKDVNGQIVYTQGTPAQKEGYDSLMSTINKTPEIIHKVMKEVVKDD